MSADNLLYSADRGELPADTRRALVNLLRGPSIDGLRSPALWATIVRDQHTLRSRLSDMFLTLVIDDEQLIAFTQQADTEELEAPTLLRRSTLGFRESVLVLHLRALLAVADAQGERCVVDRESVVDHARQFKQSDDNDSVRFDKQTDIALEKLVKLGVLHKLKGNDTRLEVSQVLRLMFTIEEIESLTRAYEAMLPGAQVSAETEAQLASVQADDELEEAATAA